MRKIKKRCGLIEEWKEILSDKWNVIGYILMILICIFALYMTI